MRSVVIDISHLPFTFPPGAIGRRWLFAAKCILQAADGALNLAYRLVSFAFGFELGVARKLAGRFLHGAFGLLGCALNSIAIHVSPARGSATWSVRIPSNSKRVTLVLSLSLRADPLQELPRWYWGYPADGTVEISRNIRVESCVPKKTGGKACYQH